LARFRGGERVRIKKESPLSPTERTPDYIRGKEGIVKCSLGTVIDPEFDRDHKLSWGPLYRIVFDWLEVHGNEAPQNSKFLVDVHESWLEEL
jgi:hypothetical protein